MGRSKKAWVRVPSAMPSAAIPEATASASSQEPDLEAGPAKAVAATPERRPAASRQEADLGAGPAKAVKAIPELAPSASSQGRDMDAGLAKAFAAVTMLPPSASSQGRHWEGGPEHSSQHSPSASGQGRGHSPDFAPGSGSQHSPSASSQGPQNVVLACPVCGEHIPHQKDLYGWSLLQWHAWYAAWDPAEWRLFGERGGCVPPRRLRCKSTWTEEDFQKAAQAYRDAGPPGRGATHSRIWWA